MKKITFLLFVCLIVCTNQAQTWTKLNLPETGKAIEDIHQDVNGNLYALTAQGLFKSVDKAENWVLLDRNMEGNHILLAANNGDVWVSGSKTGIGTIKYNGISSDQQDASIVGNPLVMAELTNGKIISITKEGTTIFNSKHFMNASTNNGASFTKNNSITNILLKTNVNPELMVKRNDEVFYIGPDKKLYKSIDKGETFRETDAAITYTNKNYGLTLDKEKNTFYALWGTSNAKDIRKSVDDGTTWTKLNSSKIWGADRVVANNDIVIIHGSFTFLYSTDGGATFTDKKTMFDSGNFPEKIVITNDGKVLATNIKGNAIVELDMTNNTQTLKTKGLDYTNPKGLSFNGKRFAVCLDGYAHYTDDNGATWKQLKGDGAFAGNTYVAKNGKVYTASSKNGTWNGVYVQDINDEMVAVTADVNNVWNMQSMFEDDKGGLYCLSNLNGLYKSTDGMSFTQMANAPFDNLNDMSMWFDESLKRIYAIVSREVYYSDDYAGTWTKGTPLTVAQNNFFKGNGGMWTFANNGTFAETGFYFSTDLLSWDGPKKPNIPFDNRWDFPVQGNLGTLYRAHRDNAYQGGTVLESVDNGLTWAAFADGLDTVKGYGFNGGGKGVPYTEILAANNKLFLGTVGSIYIAEQTTTLSTKNNNFSSYLKFYPNPVSNILQIDVNNQDIESIEIFNVLGKKVFGKSERRIDNRNINLSSLENGIYLMKIKTSISSFSKKFIKN